MRGALGVLVVGLAVLGGCASQSLPSEVQAAGESGPASSDGNGSAAAKSASTPTSASTEPLAEIACAAVAAPTQVSNTPNATELHIAGTAVFFQSGTSVTQGFKAGGATNVVYTSSSLVHSFVDSSNLLVAETTSDTDPTATLRIFSADPPVTNGDDDDDDAPPPPPAFPTYSSVDLTPGDDPGGTKATTNITALTASFFGADDTNVYLQGTDTSNNSVLVAIARADLTQTVLVSTTSGITLPQIAGGALWYVVDNQQVFKLPLPTGGAAPGTPTQVFQGANNCMLAVTDDSVFCSTGSEIDKRDLGGAASMTFMTEAQSEANQAPFGLAVANDGKLFVRDGAPDANIGHVIRVLTTGNATESLAACKRQQISGMTVDGSSIVWSEAGVGVFATAR